MILWRAGARHLLRHPLLAFLSVIGVALGVAVVTAVDVANESAHRAFQLAAEAAAGKASHQIVGGPRGLDEDLYRIIRIERGVRPAAPVVEGVVSVTGRPGTTLHLIGIDPLAEAPFRSHTAPVGGSVDLAALMGTPATGLLLRETAERVGAAVGKPLRLDVGGVSRSVVLAGYLEAGDELARQGLASVLVTDIATAQELLGMAGRLSRIDLILADGKGVGALPPGATLIPAGARAGAMDRMTRAFRLNLTALSFLALLVGMFLIYNATTFAVVRRRRLIGLMRAMGVTRREIFGQVCVEALLTGLIGTAAGIALGLALGEVLTRLVTRTINDLYFVLEVQQVALSAATLAKGCLLGIAATVAAAVPPALEATAAPPRAVLSRSFIEARTRRHVPRAALAGLVAMLGGALLLATGFGGLAAGFTGLFALILGYALTVPFGTVLVSRAMKPPMGLLFGNLGRMAARGVVVSLSRTGVATAALVVAVSATIGVGIMVDSFRHTVQQWLAGRLKADIYVTTAGTGTGRGKPPLDPALVERLRAVPGAAAVSTTRRITIQSTGGETDLLVLGIPRRTFDGFRLKEGTPDLAWQSFNSGEGIIVSEPFAFRHRLGLGDAVRLRTDRGERDFTVAGVFYDYGSDSGFVAMDRGAFNRYWDDWSVDGMGLYATPGISAAQLAEAARACSGSARVSIISSRELYEASVAVFDRTFVITGVLRLLTVVVAVVGILSALMAMQVERARELAVLRAMGLTPAELWGVVCGETGLVGLTAGLLSLPLGILQAAVLIFAVNRRSFGWTMEFSLSPTIFWQAIVLAVGAAIVAGIVPALITARIPPALAFKEDE